MRHFAPNVSDHPGRRAWARTIHRCIAWWNHHTTNARQRVVTRRAETIKRARSADAAHRYQRANTPPMAQLAPTRTYVFRPDPQPGIASPIG
ncbi:hypothetical protein ACFY5D_00960 [Paeniglutamicibacter sp. NPDC012692]|uniref:hypothetical protein n=1 Tax=Paeniglutamicibacter sp. NPDC012692 TaxID=3364388 RepID=UPI0036A0F9B2